MDPGTVLQKTAKGREEIEKRTFRVEARRRMLLVMVDGHADAAEIAARSPHPEAAGLLDALLAEGFVEPVHDTGGAAAVHPGNAAIPAGELEAVKTRACREIERLMGPDGDALALKLERARTPEEFAVEARKAREALQAFLGPRKADEFWRVLGI
jgi:hypothetical protein